MIKRLVTVLAIFSFVTVSAAIPQRTLENAVRDFNFAVTVEWDQADKGFYNDAVKKFQGSLKQLSKQGVTNKDMMKGILGTIKNKRISKEILQELEVIKTEDMTNEEAVSFITEKMELTQAEGASYTGRTTKLLLLGVVVALLVFYHCDNGTFDNSKCWEFRDSVI